MSAFSPTCNNGLLLHEQRGHASTFEFRSDDPTGVSELRAERPGPDGSFPTWATVVIVVGAIAAAVAIGVGAYLIYDHYEGNDQLPAPPGDG